MIKIPVDVSFYPKDGISFPDMCPICSGTPATSKIELRGRTTKDKLIDIGTLVASPIHVTKYRSINMPTCQECAYQYYKNERKALLFVTLYFIIYILAIVVSIVLLMLGMVDLMAVVMTAAYGMLLFLFLYIGFIIYAIIKFIFGNNYFKSRFQVKFIPRSSGVVTFRFENPIYTRLFIEANAGKIIKVEEIKKRKKEEIKLEDFYYYK